MFSVSLGELITVILVSFVVLGPGNTLLVIKKSVAFIRRIRRYCSKAAHYFDGDDTVSYDVFDDGALQDVLNSHEQGKGG